MKFNFKSRKGFTLIELLVVIGILAVLAAIAIPSVAGLIDRANVSADKTNANEMTNAVERFTSEYELYCQDIASGTIKDADSNGVPDDMDGAQGRVFNVTGADDRADITALESTGLNGRQINRDTKYPVNAETMQAIVENYTKTSSSTFEPKQSDMAYWYSPACGVVVVATPESTVAEKNNLVISGKDAKGRELDDANEVWINLTADIAYGDGAGDSDTNVEEPSTPVIVAGATFNDGTFLTWEELKAKYSGITDTSIGGYALYNCKTMTSIVMPDTVTTIGGCAFQGCSSLTSIKISKNVTTIGYMTFVGCGVTDIEIPSGVTTIGTSAFQSCGSLTNVTIPNTVTAINNFAFEKCTSLTNITYDGTVSQWNAISKTNDMWNINVPATSVHCSNGNASI